MSGSCRSTCLSACAKLVGVGEDLALVDHAALVLVHELDRVLDRDDVLVAARVLILSIMAASVVDLPLPVGPVTSTRPRGSLHSSVDRARQAELLERRDLVRNGAEGAADGALLQEEVAAEAARRP